MTDFLLTDVTTRTGDNVDIEIRDGVIDRVVAAGDGDVAAFDDNRHFEGTGQLVTQTLTEPHTHLDAVLTAGRPDWNESGTLAEGWALWEALRHDITTAEIKANATRALEWLAAHGVTRVRTHVDTSYAALTGVEALLEVQEEIADIIDLQLVGMPISGLYTDPGDPDLLRDAIDMGVDLVGGIPHNEYTREDGVKEIQTVCDIAERHGLPLDLHIDETDDPQSRFTGVLASETLKRGIGDQTTASHATAMHSYSNAYADKLIGLLAESGVDVVTNPPINAVLQGRYDDYPRRRGHTRIDELRSADVPVGVGQDDILDPWYHYGDADPLTALYVLLHFAHLHSLEDVTDLWELVTTGNDIVFGREPTAVTEDAPGSLVVYQSTSPFEALRLRRPRRLVLKDGRIISQRTPGETTLSRDGETRSMDFSM